MKIHYKTLILNLDGEEELLNKQIISKNRKYLIDYCCDEMKHAINESALKVTQNELSIQIEEYDEGGSGVTAYYPPIKYCPFCGEQIEQIEDYKAKVVRHTVHIPLKTIPAHKEQRNREVKV